MTDAELLEAFETAALPPGAFHHRDHVRAAWLLLRREVPAAAMVRFATALRRFARKAGKPELYHETVTWAYLLLIHERMARGPESDTFAAFAARNGDLFSWRPSVLDRYYRPETLDSELARRVFLLPDRLEPAT
ncbi:MAG TPA: hypothetical protein VFM88_01885 [Vicinamibacteria bacterium]|nr:hypothetical protein [Vicinamibacteria bacterium]